MSNVLSGRSGTTALHRHDHRELRHAQKVPRPSPLVPPTRTVTQTTPLEAMRRPHVSFEDPAHMDSAPAMLRKHATSAASNRPMSFRAERDHTVRGSHQAKQEAASAASDPAARAAARSCERPQRRLSLFGERAQFTRKQRRGLFLSHRVFWTQFQG